MSRKKSVPGWIGNHPFPPNEKKPVVITREKEISTVYGIEGHQVSSQGYISTDKVSLTDFTVPPGGYFSPPDVHGGDEVYYILEGKATILNIESGEVFQVSQGDAFLIPKGTWHQTFNFTEKKLKILCAIAPKIWAEEEMGAVVKFAGKVKFYKGGKSK